MTFNYTYKEVIKCLLYRMKNSNARARTSRKSGGCVPPKTVRRGTPQQRLATWDGCDVRCELQSRECCFVDCELQFFQEFEQELDSRAGLTGLEQAELNSRISKDRKSGSELHELRVSRRDQIQK